MRDDLMVRTDALREGAAALAATAHRLGHGTAGDAGLTVRAPDWCAGEALDALESAVHRWLGAVGGTTAETSRLVRTAADGYDAADGRAAGRLYGIG